MSKIIIASGPVIVEDNKVLLAKHGQDSFWKFCGGRVEGYELDIRETAKRKALEELGISLEFLDNRPYFFYTEKDSGAGLASVILAHFLAKRIGEINPGAQTREWAWLDLTALDHEDLAPNIKPVLKHFGFIKR